MRAACSGDHVVDEQHERRRPPLAAAGVNQSASRSSGTRRRDRAEVLAVLQLVEARLHRGVERRREDRARAERARAELHAALEPADHLVLPRAAARSAPATSCSRRYGSLAQRSKRLDLVVVVGRAEVGMAPSRQRARRRCAPRASLRSCASIHSAAPSAVPASPAAGCTQTSSNRPLSRSLRVHHAVQRHAAGHRELSARRWRRAASAPAAAPSPRAPPAATRAMSKCRCSSGAAAHARAGRTARRGRAARSRSGRRRRCGCARATRSRSAARRSDASAITLYSSDECRKPRCAVTARRAGRANAACRPAPSGS